MLRLLPLFALLLQEKDPTPAEIIRKLEERYAKARAMAMGVTVAAESMKSDREGQKSTLEGEFIFKEGKKLRLGLWGKIEGNDAKINLGANGKVLAVAISGMSTLQQKAVPERIQEDMAVALVRPGLFSSIFLSMGVKAGSGKDGADPDLRKTFPIKEGSATFGADEKVEVRWGVGLRDKRTFECRTIEFVMEIPEQKKSFDIKLWYSPKEMIVVKRVLSTNWKDEQTGATVKNVVTETFENIADAEPGQIPDSEFKLPGDK
jgi:hypothetical protein